MIEPGKDMEPEEFSDWMQDRPDEALIWLRERIRSMGDTQEAFAMRAMFFLVLMSLSIREMLAEGDPEFVVQHLAKLSLSMDERIAEMLDAYLVAALVHGD